MRKRKFKDYTGFKWANFEVLGLGERDSSGRIRWSCRCKCGKIVEIRQDYIGVTKSCSCQQYADMAKRNFIHGYAREPVYKAYMAIKARTLNPKNPAYHRYGGRGIRMCEEWINNPQAFIEWAMASGYKKGLHLHRKDGDGNYEPSNCIWLTAFEHESIHGKEKKRPILMLDDDNHVIGRFDSAYDYMRITGNDSRGVRRAIRDGGRSMGYRWVYESDYKTNRL